MINKWLMFEPFTEIRLKKNELLIYNTLNFKKIHTKNKLIINSIHELILRNMYCIEIKEEIYSTKVFKDFIQELKSTFSGDLIDKKICEVQPIIFPIFSGNIEKNFSQINNENILLEDRAELYSYMKHISLYINSYNTDMDFTWRENQFLTNINTGIKTDLDFKSIENLFQNIQLIDNIHFFDRVLDYLPQER